jgi:3-deoxy-D-arabino-heptulosonate 7-phosphate (DAHP) synthase
MLWAVKHADSPTSFATCGAQEGLDYVGRGGVTGSAGQGERDNSNNKTIKHKNAFDSCAFSTDCTVSCRGTSSHLLQHARAAQGAAHAVLHHRSLRWSGTSCMRKRIYETRTSHVSFQGVETRRFHFNLRTGKIVNLYSAFIQSTFM